MCFVHFLHVKIQFVRRSVNGGVTVSAMDLLHFVYILVEFANISVKLFYIFGHILVELLCIFVPISVRL